MPNLTVNVTPELLKQAKLYASQHNTTLSDLVRSNLAELTKTDKTVLEKFADGSVSSEDARALLNFKNKDELFHAICSGGLAIYHISRDKAEKMANDAILLAELK